MASGKKAEKGPKALRAGFVAIVGRPNVGKSTLLNAIVGEKVAIVSPVPQTTRQNVKGVLTEERGQVVFVDTPGWYQGRDQLGKFMSRSCADAVHGVDAIIHLTDTSRPVGEEEYRIVERLKGMKVPVIVGLNKIDLNGEHLGEYLALWEDARKEKVAEMKGVTFVPLSGLKGTQIEKLVDLIFDVLPEGDFYYEEDVISDTPQKHLVADIIREKFFLLTREEIPHSIAVVVEEMRPVKGKTLRISAQVLVERDSQKEIVIGKGGQFIKKAGTLARADLESILDGKVFLDLHVRTQKNWRDDQSMLADMGYQFT